MGGTVTIYGWQPGIGDPTLWGWLTVLNYALACWMTVRAARSDWRNARFWALVAIAMLVLGVNKQLDLQSLFTAIFRQNAIDYGWYGHRRALQKTFIEATVIIAALVVAILAYHFRKSDRTVIGAICGLGLLGAFIAARAASFHHMDQLLDLRFLALRMNHILENAGIAVIAASAALAVRRRTGRTRTKRG